MASSNSENSTLKLNSKSDWEKWIHSVKTIATTGKVNVWRYLNPAATEIDPIPFEPIMPTLNDIPNAATDEARAAAANLNDQNRWKWEQFKEKRRQHTEIMEAIGKVGMYINSSITRRNLVHIKNQESVPDMLKNLRKKLAPSAESELLRVRTRWRQLQIYNKREKITEWVLKWENMYSDALEVELPEVKGNQVCFDFLQAASSYDPQWCTATSAILRSEIRTGKSIDLADIIDQFQEQIIINETNPYTRASHSHSSFATFRGNSSSPRPKPKCPCGKEHYLNLCFYLNKRIRPENWQPDEEIAKKMEKLLKEDKNFKEKVDKSFEKGREIAEKRKKEKEAASATSTATDSSSSTNQKYTFTSKHHVAFSSSEESALYHCWILDSGSDTHVINHSTGFTPIRDPMPNEVVSGGSHVYRVEAFGSVQVTIDTPDGQLDIELRDVAYIPGFLTNVVSLERLNAKGVHWDSERPSYLKRNGYDFAYLEQVGKHWVLQKDIHIEDMNYEAKSYSVFATRKTRSDNRVKKSAKPLETIMTASMAHKVFGHASAEVIEHLEGSLRGLKIDNSVPAPSTVKCTACATLKATEIVS